MKIVLFLGAGVSIPSELPRALDVTNKILECSPSYDPKLVRLVSILREIDKFDNSDRKRPGMYLTKTGFAASGAIGRGQSSTYEDLHFLCSQISLWGIGQVENSLATPFMEKIAESCGGLLPGINSNSKLFELAKLGNDLCDHIESTLVNLLSKNYKKGLNLVLELAESPEVDELQIFTLNHDKVLEQFLNSKKIGFIDGFGKLDGDVRWHDDKTYDNVHIKVKVFKLHGSIDWFRIVRSGKRCFAIVDNSRVETARDGNGRELDYFRKRPSFLTGMEKGLLYHLNIYDDMFYRFSTALRNSSRMIMSGYSLGDFTINSFINSWLDSSPANRLILLHQKDKLSELEDRSILFDEAYEHREQTGQLKIIPKWLCDTSLPKVMLNL
jgi:hypothetical protein